MGRLTEAQQNKAIGMLRFESISQVAKFFKCSKSTISRLADRFGQTGTVKDRPKPGQQKKLSIRDEKRIRRKNPKNLVQLAREIINAWTNLRPNFIKNLIKSMRRRVRKCIQQRGGHTGY